MPALTHSSPSRTHAWIAGVDGGGSSTRVLLATTDGSHAALGRSGPSNPHHVGIEGAHAALQAAFAGAWRALGLEPQPLRGVFLGIAGLGSFADTELFRRRLHWLSLTPDAAVDFDHDLRAAHAGALGGEPGVVLIAGTGSSGFGRNQQGQTWRAGGWGWQLDDVGGGYWLAVQAIAAVLQACDGRGPATALSERVFAFLKSQDPGEFPAAVQRLSADRAQVAAFAPAVFDSAAQGDRVAGQILERGASELASIASAISRKLFDQTEVPLALVGGLGTQLPYRNALVRAVARVAPELNLVATKHSPVVGAALLALRAAKLTPTATWLETADLTAPV